MHTFHGVGHTGPAIGILVLLALGFFLLIWTVWLPWMASFFTLEILHMPRWMRFLVAISFFPVGPFYFLGDMEAKYRAAAELRAARLLRGAGFKPPDPRKGDRMHPEELEPLSPASADYV